MIILRYLEVLVGRSQNITKLSVRIGDDDERPILLDINWSMPPCRESSRNDNQPHWRDTLLDAVRQPEEFSRVLRNWIDRHEEWRDARMRFFASFSNQQYSVDRLIGAANMFDILPSTAMPLNVELSSELELAEQESRALFKVLPKSQERDSILSALGRIGKISLPHKIRHRGQILIDAAGEELFPDLFLVTDEAVKCHNHYVHGREARFDYSDSIFFFTDTLEFVFATSDLIEAGWDIAEWFQNSTVIFHPFGQYRANYAVNLQKLKAMFE